MRQYLHAIAVIILLMPVSVLANGLEIPEQGARALARGGAFSARADDPTATIHNPGALSKLKGHRLMYSHNLFWNHSSFTRSEAFTTPAGAELLDAHNDPNGRK